MKQRPLSYFLSGGGKAHGRAWIATLASVQFQVFLNGSDRFNDFDPVDSFPLQQARDDGPKCFVVLLQNRIEKLAQILPRVKNSSKKVYITHQVSSI